MLHMSRSYVGYPSPRELSIQPSAVKIEYEKSWFGRRSNDRPLGGSGFMTCK